MIYIWFPALHHRLQLPENPQACIIQENAWTDCVSSVTFQLLLWEFAHWFVCSGWKTAFPTCTSPHWDFVAVFNSDLLLAPGHFNNVLCDGSNYPRSEQRLRLPQDVKSLLIPLPKQPTSHQPVSPRRQQCSEYPANTSEHNTEIV